jgi:acyl-CoA reductase-like NAD-dependent aldehyde dehydrogenase
MDIDSWLSTKLARWMSSMMTLRQIRHFIAVAETGSISAAAQTAFISQSTLTLAIQQLEQEIGVGLFNQHAEDLGHHSGLSHGGLKHSGYGKDLSSDSLQDYSMVRHIMARHGQHL